MWSSKVSRSTFLSSVPSDVTGLEGGDDGSQYKLIEALSSLPFESVIFSASVVVSTAFAGGKWFENFLHVDMKCTHSEPKLFYQRAIKHSSAGVLSWDCKCLCWYTSFQSLQDKVSKIAFFWSDKSGNYAVSLWLFQAKLVLDDLNIWKYVPCLLFDVLVLMVFRSLLFWKESQEPRPERRDSL